MNRRSGSYKAYRDLLIRYFDSLTVSAIMAEMCKRGIERKVITHNFSHKCAELIADKALHEGSIPVCYSDADDVQKDHIDALLRDQHMFPVVAYRRYISNLLEGMTEEGIKEMALDNNIRISGSSRSCMVNSVVKGMVDRYTLNSYSFVWDCDLMRFMDLWRNCPLGTTKDSYARTMRSKLCNMNSAELRQFVSEHHILVGTEDRDKIIDTAVEFMTNLTYHKNMFMRNSVPVMLNDGIGRFVEVTCVLKVPDTCGKDELVEMFKNMRLKDKQVMKVACKRMSDTETVGLDYWYHEPKK